MRADAERSRQPDVEARIGGEMAQRALWLGPLIVAGAGLLGGWDAAVAALVGAVLATGSFWLTGRALSWSARRSPQMLGAVAMGGFLVRLLVLTAVVWVALSIFSLDLMGLFIGLGVTYVTLLVSQAKKELAAK